MASTSAQKAWWRRYFHVHPALLEDVTGNFGATTSSKQKLYCMKCFDQHISTRLWLGLQRVREASRHALLVSQHLPVFHLPGLTTQSGSLSVMSFYLL